MVRSHQTDAAASDAGTAWLTFRRELEACDARLVAELRATSSAVQALIARQIEQFGLAVERRPSARSLDAVAPLYQQQLAALLVEPLEAYRRERPQQRVLGAFDDYDRAIEQLVRVMPDTLACTGAEWVAVLGASELSTVTWARLRVRRRLRVSVRPSLLLGVRAHRAARRLIDGRLLVALAGVSLELLTPWQAMRRAQFSPADGEWAGGSPEAEQARIRARVARHAQRADRALADIDNWLSRATGRIATCLPTRRASAHARIERLTTRDDRHREFLGRQGRAVDAALDLESRLSDVEAALFDAARASRDSIETEHVALIDELNRVAAWLEGWQPDEESAFPMAAANVVAAPIRVGAFSQSADALLLRLPASVEVSAHPVASPGLRPSWTTQTPRAIVRGALDSMALPVIG